ncbi:sodium/potassium/calcium exchanger 5-like isoform X2 [Eurosta solidaginis]|uniref:sodium/potassium/calcium exchanger 5-like isoform X2 n=1 Tax=Eurosta solidaginis TaxID=178769 RepID=UPI003530BA2A
MLPLKQYQLTRQLLSIVNTIAVDLENSGENEGVTEALPDKSGTHKIADKTTPVSLSSNATKAVNCTTPAILEFPADGLTRTQRQHGWIVLHILVALYCFWSLAIICDDYFLPAIELICQALSMQADVVGATFMAVATSSPELFMNCIGTFVTKGDLGIDTIVGSSVFSLLAIPACCGIFVSQCVPLDWWPVSRDCFMYFLAVLGLIGTLWDGKVMWYESMLLFMAYFLYMAVMFHNDKMARSARRLISAYRRKLHFVRSYREVSELTPMLRRQQTYTNITQHTFATSTHSINSCASNNDLVRFYISTSNTQIYPDLLNIENCQITDVIRNDSSSLTVQGSGSVISTDVADIPWQRNEDAWLHFLLRWPITFLLYLTVPDCRKHPRAKYFTIVVAVVWIAVLSYVVAYAITVIGDTLNIPDSVMGLTILSAGMSVPETVSSIIVTKQGDGAMGISNAIGSNTFDILLCLSVPWFIKAYFLPNKPDEMWVTPVSKGFTYSVSFLLASVSCLFLTLRTHRFMLNKKVGVICAILYLCFIVCAVLIELDVFFPVSLPVCEY